MKCFTCCFHREIVEEGRNITKLNLSLVSSRQLSQNLLWTQAVANSLHFNGLNLSIFYKKDCLQTTKEKERKKKRIRYPWGTCMSVMTSLKTTVLFACDRVKYGDKLLATSLKHSMFWPIMAEKEMFFFSLQFLHPCWFNCQLHMQQQQMPQETSFQASHDNSICFLGLHLLTILFHPFTLPRCAIFSNFFVKKVSFFS